MKLSTTFILLLLSLNAFSISLDKRRSQIISIIDEELSEVSKLAKQTGNRNPDHLLRMAELNLEKARLWREKENQEYIALANETRRKVNKRNYFKKSGRYFQNANTLCIKIVKSFKRYQSIGDVYYILGYNAKEAGKPKTALKYFSKAQKKTKRKSITRVKSQISQAELYYNQKKYRKAIPLYEKSLSVYEDKWWTKDSLNLAWCYFRANKYSLAISKMKEVFKKSSSRKFIDMRTSVERDIGLFFATAGKIEEGISFYKKIGINFTDQLLRIAVTMKAKGQYQLAKKTLEYALKYEKDLKRKDEIYIEQLDLYSSFSQRSLHLSTSKQLFRRFQKNELSVNKKKTLTFHVGKQGAILQKQVISKTYKRLYKQRKQKASMAIAYFGMLADLDKKKRDESIFLQGETAFSMAEYTRALSFYNSAFDESVLLKNSKFKARSMDGMLSCLGKKSVSRKTKESYYIPVYNKYLQNYPRGKRSLSIYQKLFKAHLDKSDYKSGKSTLDDFKRAFPKNWKVQEAMIAELMEINRKKKENNKIRLWIRDIDAKKYFVSKRYAKKLRELLTSIQIDDVQMDLKKGKKKKALVGYHRILLDSNSTKRSKINAKYNLAALYYEMGSVAKSFEWSNKALDEMTTKDAVSFSDSFLTISTFLFTKLEFSKSAMLAERIVNKLCKTKSRKKQTAFKNASFMYLADHKLADAERLIDNSYRCKIASANRDTIRFELLKDYSATKNWREYEKHYKQLARKKRNWPKLIIPSSTLSLVHSDLGNNSQSRAFRKNKNSYFQYSQKTKLEIPVRALDMKADEKLVSLRAVKNQLLSITLQYPASRFQQAIKRKFSLLDKLVSRSSAIQNIGSGDGIVKAYKILIETHYAFAEQVRNFTPQKIKKEFLPLFKKDIEGQIVAPLLSQAKNYENDAEKTISKNEILSVDNTGIKNGSLALPVRFWFAKNAILMDRGGK